MSTHETGEMAGTGELIPPEVRDLMKETDEKERIKLKQAASRNVIFVGRTRAGKSTLFKVMQSPANLAKFGSLFSDTKGASLSTFTVEEVKPGSVTNYTLNVIDTPGLFELVSNGAARTNDSIKEVISKCLEFEITRIHAVFFVCSFTAGVNDQDIKAFREFVQLFDGAQDQIAMIITRTETWSDKRKKKLLEDLRIHPGLADLREVIKDKIFFSGAIDEDVLDDAGVVKKRYAAVADNRKSIYEFIFKAEKGFAIKNMDTYRKQSLLVGEVVQKLLKVQEEGRKLTRKSPEFPAKLQEEETLFKQLKTMNQFISPKLKNEMKAIEQGRLTSLP